MDRNTVIKALECRKNAGKRCCNPCEETGNCHYAIAFHSFDGGVYLPYICDKERICTDAIELLKEQEAIEPKFRKLKVPEKCGECRSCNTAITLSPYCRMEAASSVNSQMDISSIYVNIDSRPVWCPIIKVNDALDRMPFEKRAEIEKLITELSPWLGGEDLWE